MVPHRVLKRLSRSAKKGVVLVSGDGARANRGTSKRSSPRTVAWLTEGHSQRKATCRDFCSVSRLQCCPSISGPRSFVHNAA